MLTWLYMSGSWLWTNLIHDFTSVTFSVKLAFFCEKRLFPWNLWFFVNFNTFTFIYEGFRVLSAAFVQILLFATMCHTSALNSWHAFTVLLTYIPPHLIWSMASSLFNPRTWQSFLTISVQVFFGLPLGLAPSTSYSISLPNHCLLFATHAHTISVTPSVNCPGNLTHFKNSPMKSRMFPVN